jgi:outer membrane scaffolding protein for murein synthesis (MipA/OmpV family)
MTNLVQAYIDSSRLDDAVVFCKEEYDLLKEKFGQNHRRTLTTLYNLSMIYFKKGDRDNAITHLTLYIEKATLLFGANDHHVLDASTALAQLR